MDASSSRSQLNSFKGIALFTPGGDVVYCLDPYKRTRWHLHLCAALQDWLKLPEPPHFLVSCFTATVECWQDPATQETHTIAEASPMVFQYRALLNQLFNLGEQPWQLGAINSDLCNPHLLMTYRQQFPQLWQCHSLLLRVDHASEMVLPEALPHPTIEPNLSESLVLRLFVSSYSPATQRILHNLHQVLEQNLNLPYTLKVVDISKSPEQAEIDQITATPALVRIYPKPVRKIVGELDQFDRVLHLLSN
ncbi:MAG: circadian clock KaiB family protein [Synechococcales bacterium]|nr:circadian clock KaiB family protein [Synechococcales bacterium]